MIAVLFGALALLDQSVPHAAYRHWYRYEQREAQLPTPVRARVLRRRARGRAPVHAMRAPAGRGRGSRRGRRAQHMFYMQTRYGFEVCTCCTQKR